jgi:hypothetical protein
MQGATQLRREKKILKVGEKSKKKKKSSPNRLCPGPTSEVLETNVLDHFSGALAKIPLLGAEPPGLSDAPVLRQPQGTFRDQSSPTPPKAACCGVPRH